MVGTTAAGDVLYGPGGGDRKQMARLWPVPLVVGVISVILGFVVLSYNTSSLAVVSILVGVSLCYTGVSWLVTAALTHEHRWFPAIVGALLLVAGVFAFVYPDEATAPTAGLLVLIPKDAPGRQVNANWDTLGMRATRSDDT